MGKGFFSRWGQKNNWKDERDTRDEKDRCLAVRAGLAEGEGLADDFVEFFFGGTAAEGEGAGDSRERP